MLIFWIALLFLFMGVLSKPLAEKFLSQLVALCEKRQAQELEVNNLVAKARYLNVVIDALNPLSWWVGGILFTPALIAANVAVWKKIHTSRPKNHQAAQQ